jgi:hypothetical protein
MAIFGELKELEGEREREREGGRGERERLFQQQLWRTEKVHK